MNNLREEFEKLSNIKCFINIFEFDEIANEYKYKIGKNIGDHTLGFVNGAWMAFQEQQKKLDAARKEISRALNCCESIETECVLVEIKELLK